jgi:superfamily II DNA helicase RecQ
MKMKILAFSLATIIFAIPFAAHSAGSALDTMVIEKAIGKAGELKDNVYKVSLPRKDLAVSVNGVKVKPGLALGSWVAFKDTGGQAVVDGDLVLTEDEVTPVFQKLRKEGIEVSALHNHLIGESPRVMFLHIAAKGDPAKLAAGIKAALSLTKTPIDESSGKPGEASAKIGSEEEAGFNVEQIQETLGHKGHIKGGVLQVSIPRSEHIKMEGVTLPPSMGMATALNFQATDDGKVAATGDFVLTRDEVDRVTKALAENGIAVTALHNHLVHGIPDLYFMHFWANDSAEKVAKGLRAGLDAMKKSKKES